ncbi:DUF3368 domain-containing protein [Methylococcus capsulatus]|uniref:DUF3368 domain-containing protein n=1 Tax=Methylococcus capsulatus TaxID=414 RepID=UPI002FD91188
MILDDLAARRCAKSMDIRVIGSMGVIVMAKQKRLISEAGPIIARLRRAGLYLDEEVVAAALEQPGEK